MTSPAGRTARASAPPAQSPARTPSTATANTASVVRGRSVSMASASVSRIRRASPVTDEDRPRAARHDETMSDEIGPVDYLVVEYPTDQMTGEGLPILMDLVDRGTIRVLDLVFARKDHEGKLTVLTIADLDNDGDLDLAVFEGASSGL